MGILKKLFGSDRPSTNQVATKRNISYQQLLEASIRDPDSVDFTELRLAYAESPEYDPYHVKGNVIPVIRAFAEALEQGEPERRIKTSNDLLVIDQLYVWAHVHAGLNYMKVGDQERATFHQKFVRRWWDSIHQSGDGRSFQSAFAVVSLNEEYTLLGLLRVQSERQRLEEWKGHLFDVFEVHDPESGGRTEIYFNIDLIAKGAREGRAQLPSESDVPQA